MDPFFAAVRALFNGQTFGWNNVLDIAIVFVLGIVIGALYCVEAAVGVLRSSV